MFFYGFLKSSSLGTLLKEQQSPSSVRAVLNKLVQFLMELIHAHATNIS